MKPTTIKDFLTKVNSSFENADTKEMLEFGYYEDENKHYELNYEETDQVTEDTIILDIEESQPMRI